MELLRWLGKRAVVVLVGTAVFLVGIVVFDPERDIRWLPSSTVLTIAVYTAIAFGTIINTFRAAWIITSFWVALAGLLVAHVLVYAAAVNYLESSPRLFWLFLATVGEIMLLDYLLNMLGFNAFASRGQKHGADGECPDNL